MADGLYAGTTLPDNGRPMLLLDPLGLAHRARLNEMPRPVQELEDAVDSAAKIDGGSALLFKELSGELRLIALAAVERVEDVDSNRLAMAAGQVRLSIDGESRAVIGLAARPETPFTKLLHLTDGRVQALYAVDDVIDIVRLPSHVEPAPQPGLIGGVALIGDLQIEVLDVYWIFSMLLGVAPATDRPICHLIGQDDAWTRSILAPLVAAAGYTPVVSRPEDSIDGEAAISIIVGDLPVAPARFTGQVIRLSDTLASANADANTIYRYDRAGLLGRLIAGQQRQSA